MYGIFLSFSSYGLCTYHPTICHETKLTNVKSATNTLYYRNQCLYICCISRPDLTAYWLTIRVYHHSCNHLIQVRTMSLLCPL